MFFALHDQAGTFHLEMDRAAFNNKVVPWLESTLGWKRGKKKNGWAVEQSPEELLAPVPRYREGSPSAALQMRKHSLKAQYWCRVHLSHNRDCIAFLARWGDHLRKQSYFGKINARACRPTYFHCQWVDIAHTVRWMHRNVKSTEWTMTMDSHLTADIKRRWSIYTFSDEAKMAFQLIKPSHLSDD